MKAKRVTLLDRELRTSVERQLDYAPDAPSKEIGVSVSDGVVTLSGYAETYADKTAAERAVKSVYGVRAIANDIEVKPPSEIVDPDLAANIVDALRRNVTVPDDRIKVTIKKGWVTLEGKVDWGYQREAVEDAIRYLAGVRGVSNNIEVKPKVSAEDIQAKIEEVFRRSAEIDARRIRVEANGGYVTLSGNVRSYAEKQAALKTAWDAPGVIRVVNNIEIIP
ncbi:MAG: BON domain-containing protein [Acidobacteria bacterium]|nr:BON domain-containing protein [Acidobacteriota bacterium]